MTRHACRANVNHKVTRATVFLGVILSISVGVSAQQAGASVSGRVVDTSGAAVPGVAVTIAGPTLENGRTSVFTDQAGAYAVAGVPPGTYQLTAELSGFRPVPVPILTIGPDERRAVNITMEVAGLSESITVFGEPRSTVASSSSSPGSGSALQAPA